MKKKEATSRTTPCDRSPTVQRELTASPAIKEYEATVRETKIMSSASGAISHPSQSVIRLQKKTNMAASNLDGDALAEAMSMLDAVNNGSQDFEDFAIDSDDEDANNLLHDLDLTNDLVDLGHDEAGYAPSAVGKGGGGGGGGGEGAADLKAANGERGNVATAQRGMNLSQSSGDAFVHPLQMTGAKNLDPLSQMALNLPDPVASVTGSYSGGSNNFVAGDVLPSGGTVLYWRIRESVVESAEAQVLGNVPSSSPHSAMSSGMAFSTASTSIPPADTVASNITYQERQRLLQQQYHASNPSAAINSIYTAPSNIVSRSSQTSLSTTSSVPSNTSSPTKTATTMGDTQSQQTTSSHPITFLDKLTNNLDTPTKTKLTASALGNLLPWERVIMFLNSLRDWRTTSGFVDQRQKNIVFEIPLASIERVEKVLSSSQASITGVAPASSLNDYSSYLGILPSSSTVFSASSAMSQLGSQMKPLLGTMRAAASGGGTNPNILVSHHLRVATISKQWQHPLVIYGKVDQVPYKFALPMGADEALNTYAFPGRTNLGYLIQFESRRGEVMACCSAAQGMTANLLPRRQFLVHRGCFFLWMNSIDRGSFF
eukprot:CCRYP_015833-RD/>CCRYP_015833-RD protein AED:0.28 eAED:0.28 QI:86/0.2/0.16/1/0.2/0.16/6/0/600